MNKLTFVFVFVFLCTHPSNASTNFVFGVKPGITLNSAYVGIKQGGFMPYMGANFLSLSADGEHTKLHENFVSEDTYTRVFDSIDFSGHAFLVVPHLGAKIFLGEKLAKPYLFAEFFMGLPMVDLDIDGYRETSEFENGKLIDYQKETANIDYSEIKNTVNDALSFWGFTVGGGAEYFFDPHFSVGGEYGFRVLFDTATHENQTGDFDEVALNGYRNDWKLEVNASLKLSYAIFSLNYYF